MNHLTVDAGNSQITTVLFRDSNRLGSARLATRPRPCSSEIVRSWRTLVEEFNLKSEELYLTISSVVPNLKHDLMQASREIGARDFHWVSWDSQHPFSASESARQEIGSDIICGLVGACQFQKPPFVVIDCGTATTLTLVDEEYVIQGVAILPGLATQLLSLTQSAPHLPKEVSLTPPPLPYGDNTETALQSGILYGHAASIEGLLNRYRELYGDLTAIGCGGLYNPISSLCPSVREAEPELVNIGCRVLTEKLLQERV